MSTSTPQPQRTITLRTLTMDDLPGIRTIHMRAFPHRAMTALGPDVIERYYAWLMNDIHVDAQRVGAFEGETLLGFCFGGRYRDAMSGFLRRNRDYLVRKVASRPWLLLTNELFRSRIAMAMRILNPPPPRDMTPDEAVERAAYLRGFGILAIAVDPATQGQGVGKLLMQAAQTEALRRGVDHMNLSVDVGNARAIAFYERIGWHKKNEGSAWRGEMVKPIRPPSETR